MGKCSMVQVFWAMVGFLMLPVAVWGGEDNNPSQISRAELAYNFDLLASNTEGAAYENSAGLSLSLTEESSALAVADAADWGGLMSDTAYFMGYQLSIIGVLYVMPVSISGWTDETKEDFSIQQYKDNVRQIVWDKDDWWINYILHPYWGGVYYVRAQQRGFGELGSFVYSATLSAIYEFGAEAFFEKPSIQDLIVTPGAGYFVGKYFMGVRADIQARTAASGQLSGRDKFILIMTDPMGALNEKFDKLFGRTTQVSLRPMLGPQFQKTLVSDNRFEGGRQLDYLGTSNLGMKMTLQW